MTSLFSKVKEGVMTAKKALATDDEAEHGYERARILIVLWPPY
jgi:hypothetical protein